MADKVTKICGIRCSVRSPKLRRAIRAVLRRIEQRFPEDAGRIHTLVLKFVGWDRPYNDLLGQWITDGAISRECPGIVALYELDIIPPRYLVAHELGHVCTRQEDLGEEWGTGSLEKWKNHGKGKSLEELDEESFARLCRAVTAQTEATLERWAHHYVYKWGFKRSALMRKQYGWSPLTPTEKSILSGGHSHTP